MSRTLASFVTAAFAALVADVVPAQSPWADLLLPQGVAASALAGQGKLVTYDDGTTLHVYSAVTRRWTSTSKSTTAQVHLFNDVVALVESGYCRALASHTGEFVDVQLAGQATIWNQAGNKNDSILLVAAGGSLHAFSGFTGSWTSRAIGAGAAGESQRHVALLVDGGVLAGMSAFDGAWVERPAPAATTLLNTDGTVGLVETAAAAFAFSANTRRWDAARKPANASFARGDDWCAWYGSEGVLAFSGLRGAFARDDRPVTAVAGATDLYALFVAAGGYSAWSAVTGDHRFVPRLAASLTLGPGVALLKDTTRVRAYDPFRQALAMHPDGAPVVDAGASVAFLTTAAGRTWAYSIWTGAWHAAPASTLGSPAAMTTTTVGLDATNDCYAFSPRDGQFVPRGAPSLGFAYNPSSAPLLAHDAASFAAFDPRTGDWHETARLSPLAPLFRVWRTTSFVVDGTATHAFGAQAGRWHSHSVAQAPSTANANSEVGYVVAGNRISAAGMVAELVSTQQFPQFRRVQPFDAPFEFAAAPPPGSVGVAALCDLGPQVALPGVGTLWLSPTAALLQPVLPTAATPVPRVTFTLPPAPSLRGATLAGQLVVVDPGGAVTLGDLVVVTPW